MPVGSSITSTGGSSTASSRAGAFVGFETWLLMSLSSLHGDAARLRRFAALDADVKHPVAIVGRKAVGVDVVGQSDHAPEAAAEALVDVQRGLLVAAARGRRSFARDRQHAPVEMDLDLRRV